MHRLLGVANPLAGFLWFSWDLIWQKGRAELESLKSSPKKKLICGTIIMYRMWNNRHVGVAFCQLYGIFTFVIHISIRVSVVPVKLIIQQIWGWGICDLLMARYLRWLFCFFFFSVCELVIF